MVVKFMTHFWDNSLNNISSLFICAQFSCEILLNILLVDGEIPYIKIQPDVTLVVPLWTQANKKSYYVLS